jgi:phenylalanyl-tRNA synthetase beta chain
MGQDLPILRQSLCSQGYHEIVSYSFIDKKLQHLLDPTETGFELLNPITADMAVMRTNLWPGLVNTLLYNKSRQQHRVRLFEMGTCFTARDGGVLEQSRLGGLITRLVYPEQWGMTAREADFYDLKGDVENILSLYSLKTGLLFKQESHPALHPGQAAGIYHNGQKLGILGALHPTILQALDITASVFVFELDLNRLLKPDLHHFSEVSKFPEIRRDLAILVNQAIPAKEIQDTIKMIAGDWLKEVFVFDVYQGKGISPGLKSIALALILQHPARTLVDDEVAELIDRIITTLKGQLGAELRS